MQTTFTFPLAGRLPGWLRLAAVLLFLLSLPARLLAQSGAVSVTQSFSYTGQIVTYTVPTGVTSLTITARGGEGGFGPAQFGGNDGLYAAGKGALIAGIITVSSGQTLKILVGQKSPNRNGGGGGSFVTTNENSPLIIAGGGGGSGSDSDQATKDGQAGRTGGANGGSNGQGGPGVYGGSGGGGGLLTDGGGATVGGNGEVAQGGKAFVNGGAGSSNSSSFGQGGFGGGGSGSGVGAGGGGGGYSGGGGGGNPGPGGGGGSYNAGTSLTAVSGANTGNGLVTITYIPAIRYVKATASGTGNGSSWANASSDLQAMINASQVRQVWVAGGRYTRTGGGSFAMKNNVAIYGGFAGNETSLSQRPAVNPVAGSVSSTTLTVDSNGGSVISNITLDNTAVLDGVVVTGGQTGNGGGFYNYNSSPVLTNCSISGNSATNRGGGFFNSNSSPSLTNCLISGNSTSSRGGGFYNEIGSSPSLTNCLISGNSTTDRGGGFFNQISSSPSLTNCLISGNSASSRGGGLYNDTSSPRLTGCTLTANRASFGAALINYSSSQPTLSNCILWDNQESNNTSINNDNGTGVTANYCLIGQGESDYTGSNNLVATNSPFASATNYQLNQCSVAINAGDPNSSPANNGSTDLAGNPRFYQNGRIDIGAYEYQGDATQPLVITQQPPASRTQPSGTTVSVSVSVTGSNPAYQWYKNSLNSAVPNQTSATLTIPNAQTSDSGSYSVVVTNACYSVTSTAFTLTVDPPATPRPKLDTPADGATTSGQPTFTGTAPASSSVTVQVVDQTNTTVRTLNTTASSPGGSTGSFSVQLPADQALPSGTYSAYAQAQLPGQSISSSSRNRFTVDNTAPSVTLSASVGNGATTMSQPTSFTASFSKPVTAFSQSGITVSNGQVSGFTGNGATYTFAVTASSPGQVSVSIPANAAQDGVGNGNTASNTYSYTYQQPMTGMPMVNTPANGTLTNNRQPAYSGSAPTGSTVSVFVNGNNVGTTTATGGSFSLMQPTALPDGAYQVYVTAQLSGQTTSNASNVNSFTVDATAPTVTLSSSQVASGGTTASSPVAFSATFSEPVTGFSTSGISVSNGTASNLSGNGGSYSFQVTPTSSGPVSVVVNANAAQDGATNGNTASNTYSFTYQPAPTVFAIVSATLTGCQLVDDSNSKRYKVLLQPRYVGQDNSQPTSFSVANELGSTTAPGPYTLYLWGDNTQITLVAKQPGSNESRYAYPWQADCPAIGGGTTPPPPPSQPTTTGIPSQTGTVGQYYSLDVSPYFNEPSGQKLTYTSMGLPPNLSLNGSVISGTPSQSGVYGVSVTATNTDKNSVSSSFTFTVNPAPTQPPTNPPTQPTGFTITGASVVSCEVVDQLNSKRYRVLIQPQYAGQDNSQPTSFSVANELSPTNQPGPYTLYLWGDNQLITLVAKQPMSGEARYGYRWQADCPATRARKASEEAGTGLQVRLLGNPVTNQQVGVEIRGVAGQPVELRLFDQSGRLLHSTHVDQAGEVEQQTLSVSPAWGSMLLLKASSGPQQQSLKVIQGR